MKNHELNHYGFVEGMDFEGLMPSAAEKIGTIGASDVVVKMHGFDAKGMDALEVIDIEKVFVTEETTETENVVEE